MCLPVSNVMPGSKSHKRRSWVYLAASQTLVITQGKEVDSYAVEVQPGEGASCSFILAHKAEDSFYEVRLLPGGRMTCSGQWCGKQATCKHRDAIAGVLAHILPDEPQADERTDATDSDAIIQEMEAYFASQFDA
jgi:hypothetical protein